MEDTSFLIIPKRTVPYYKKHSVGYMYMILFILVHFQNTFDLFEDVKSNLKDRLIKNGLCYVLKKFQLITRPHTFRFFLNFNSKVRYLYTIY